MNIQCMHTTGYVVRFKVTDSVMPTAEALGCAVCNKVHVKDGSGHMAALEKEYVELF